MKKSYKLLSLVVLLVILIGSYAYMINKPKKQTEILSTSSKAASKERLLNIEKETINKLEFISQGEKTILEKKNNNNNGWVLEGKDTKLNQHMVESVVYNIVNLTSEVLVDENCKDLAKYGLEEAKAIVRIFTKDGMENVIYLGDKTPMGNSYYVSFKNSTRVYTILANNQELFKYTAKDFRDKTLATDIDTKAITYLNILSDNNREIEIKLKDNKEGQSVASYSMIKPFKENYNVDNEKLKGLITGIEGIHITEVIEDNAKDLAIYGLDKPSVTIVVKDNNKELKLLVGKEKDDKLAYFKIGRSQAVYTIDKEIIQPFYIDPFKLISKLVFVANIDDVDKIVINNKDKEYTMDISSTSTKKEGKEEIAYTYKIDNKEIKEDDFRRYYQTILGAFIVDAENHKDVKQDKDVTIKFYLNKGEQKEVTISYFPYNDDFYAVFINNKSEFLIAKSKVNKVIKDIEDLGI